ncbi:MAG TPA: ATP-binding protein [Candidatus Limnocylindrales bacterium]|nr:ATP-binding protein [Candidatus Limnocylindrales bacterium]
MLLGWTPEEVSGRRFHELSHHSRADRTPHPIGECPIYAVLHDGEPRRVEEDVFWRSDGTSFPVAYSSTPLILDGAIQGAVVAFEDISERLAARDALQRVNDELELRVQERTEELARSEARWRSLIAAAPDIVLTVDRRGRVLYVNRGERFKGPRAATTIQDLVPASHHAAVAQEIERALREGTSGPYEVPIGPPDGATWYEGRAAGLGEDEVVVFATDITERRVAAGRREAELNVSRVLASAKDLDTAAADVLRTLCLVAEARLAELWLIDDEQGVLWRAGYWAQEDLDASGIDAVSDFGVPPSGGTATLLIAGAEPVWLPDAAAHPDFTRSAAFRQVGLRSLLWVPLRVGDTAIGVVVCYFDHTDEPGEAVQQTAAALGLQLAQAISRWRALRDLQVAKEEAERANRAKSELLSRMSHELRTPLNAILGFGQLLESSELSADDRESVEQMLHGGRRLLGLIDRVLDIVRLDAGRITLAIEPVAVEEVMREAVDTTGTLARQRRATFDMSGLAPDLFVLADRHRLVTILRNLLSNALTFGPEGGVVRVLSRPVGEDGGAVIEVVDDGPGIPEQDRERIFTPLEAASSQEGHHGAGVGLALARRLARAMGGELSVRSAPGSGSTFAVELPAAPVSTASGKETAARHVVLYIEDNLANLRLIERSLLGIEGLVIKAAMTGAAGLDAARRRAPDVILLDANLPDTTGEEVLAELRADERTASVPVIVLTSDASPGQAQRFGDAGAAHYITKPIDTVALPRLILGLLDSRETKG